MFKIKDLVEEVTAKKKSKVRSKSAKANLKDAEKALLSLKKLVDKDSSRAKQAGEATDLHQQVSKNLGDTLKLFEKRRSK